ncbi:unnamed protein product [Linum tenue]|uniref:RRM domain-containing protein n=1 Tax=Linum tenue TaxID=586396 RepID=A0AAV0LSD4_9ROSI|nr:unnamed protein product [Linum tenue]
MMQQPGAGVAPQMAASDPQYQQQQWMMQQQQQHHPVPPPAGWTPPPVPPPTQYGVPQPAGAGAGADEIKSLWIGDLQPWMDETYLISTFSGTGEVVSTKVIRNKQTNLPEGYGFIEFVSHAAAERILQTYNGTPMPNCEQSFRMNWATLGAGERRQDDGPEYTIFVGDLAADVNDYLLQETFKNVYSSVKGAKVVTDRATGRSKGYGFVRFGEEGDQMRAMVEMNGQYCSSRPMRIGPAASKKPVAQQFQTATYQNAQGSQGEMDPNNTTIFVGALDPSVSDDVLRSVFGKYGELVHVKIPPGKRCGFVQFANRSSAEQALQMLNGTQLAGQSIRLSWGRSPSNKQAQPEQNQWNGGGGYYGYAQGYDAAAAYGYAAAPQDPSMYYGGYPGYGNYQQPGAYQQPGQVYQQPQQSREDQLGGFAVAMDVSAECDSSSTARARRRRRPDLREAASSSSRVDSILTLAARRQAPVSSSPPGTQASTCRPPSLLPTSTPLNCEMAAISPFLPIKGYTLLRPSPHLENMMQQPGAGVAPQMAASDPQYQQQQWMMQQQQQHHPVPPPAGWTPPPVPPPTQYGVAQPAGAGAGADDIKSLWIGDLQPWMDETYLISTFSGTGEVVSAKVIRNKQTNLPEGYGFIEFVSHAAAERILQTYNGTPMPNCEQSFRMNWATLGAGERRQDDGPEYTIFVGDLAADVNDYLLQETFKNVYSSVKGAKVVTDRATGRSKGYGFVRFGEEGDQMRAMVEMNGQYCSSRPMRIGPAASKKPVGQQFQTGMLHVICKWLD